MACVDIISGAGTKLYVRSTIPTHTATGWAAATASGWTEIGQLSSIGSFGPETNVIEYKTLEGTICKAAGSTNYGNTQISMALVPENAGQIALQAAQGLNRGFKVTLDDATTTLTTPTVMYFAGVVAGFKYDGVNDSDSILQATSTVAVNSTVITVARHA